MFISALPLISLLVTGSRDLFFRVFAVTGAAVFITAFSLSRVSAGDKTVTYSEGSEINLALNRVYKREWSKCFFAVAMTESVMLAAVYFIMLGIGINLIAVTAYIFLSSVCLIVLILSAYNKIRDERKRLLRIANETVYADGDKYWHRGAYNNPNDNRSWVEKRIGYGMTINTAKKGGRLFVALTIGFAVLIALGLAIYLIPLDFGAVKLSVSRQTVTVNVPMYESYTFSTREIAGITLSDDFPRATKVFGANSDRLYIGRFRVAGYKGISQVFIHRDNPPFIVVELESGWVFVNGGTREETEMYYDLLTGEVSQ
jgi:hypothetical protein